MLTFAQHAKLPAKLGGAGAQASQNYLGRPPARLRRRPRERRLTDGPSQLVREEFLENEITSGILITLEH
mgnify:CR=1 FL=1